MTFPIGPCLRCGRNFRLTPDCGNWYWACACPPPQTYTTNSTAGIHSAPDANGRLTERQVQFLPPQPDFT